MPSPKHKSSKSKKEKNKLIKLIESDAEDEENIHELSFYANDRVKLMKEVLKIIKPRQIKRMAPDCIKDLDIEEINSMLLEELLGISNKRLKYIFNGENLNEDSSSSTDSEEDKPIDLISLDDVSEDDFIDLEADSSRKHKRVKKEKDHHKHRSPKKEKASPKRNNSKEPLREENLMSVLELLELQARARAIKSQLALEASRKEKDAQAVGEADQPIRVDDDDDDEDAVIIQSPKNEEIVITSDSENENVEKPEGRKMNKIKLIRDRFIAQTSKSIDVENEINDTNSVEVEQSSEAREQNKVDKEQNEESDKEHDKDAVTEADKEESKGADNEENKEEKQNKEPDKREEDSEEEDDGIIINLDHEEMAGIIELN